MATYLKYLHIFEADDMYLLNEMFKKIMCISSILSYSEL